MPRYIIGHRRGTASQWASATKPIQEGELGIKYSDDGTMASIIIGIGSGSFDILGLVPVTKVRNISLPTANWVSKGEGTDHWTQDVTINGVTENSKVDLQPTAELQKTLEEDAITLVAENNDGTVTIHAICEDAPEADITIQATITEVATT